VIILNREHLGVEENNSVIDVCDPVAAVFYKDTWLKQASINTTIFEKVGLILLWGASLV